MSIVVTLLGWKRFRPQLAYLSLWTPLNRPSRSSMGDGWYVWPLRTLLVARQQTAQWLRGGDIATNDSELADLLALTRAFGFRLQDQTDHFGVNAKLNEVHAAMALASLDGVAEQVDRNRRLYERYVDCLGRSQAYSCSISIFPKGLDARTLFYGSRTTGLLVVPGLSNFSMPKAHWRVRTIRHPCTQGARPTGRLRSRCP